MSERYTIGEASAFSADGVRPDHALLHRTSVSGPGGSLRGLSQPIHYPGSS